MASVGNPSSGISEEEVIIRDVTEAIKTELSPSELDVQAEVGCGGQAKLEIFIVSEKFEGIPLLKRHKLVQTAVRNIRDYENRVHAITITKSLTPSQFSALKENSQ